MHRIGSFLNVHTHPELLGLGSVVDSVGQFDRAEVVEVLIEDVKIVLL